MKNKFKTEAKDLVPFLITFCISSYAMYNVFGLCMAFNYATFMGVMVGLWGLFLGFATLGMFVISLMGILNYLGLANIRFGKLGLIKINEWALMIFAGLSFVLFFLFLAFGFSARLLVESILFVVVFFLLELYLCKVSKVDSIIPMNFNQDNGKKQNNDADKTEDSKGKDQEVEVLILEDDEK